MRLKITSVPWSSPFVFMKRPVILRWTATRSDETSLIPWACSVFLVMSGLLIQVISLSCTGSMGFVGSSSSRIVWFRRIQEFLGFVTMPFVSFPGECPDPHGEQRLQVAY